MSVGLFIVFGVQLFCLSVCWSLFSNAILLFIQTQWAPLNISSYQCCKNMQNIWEEGKTDSSTSSCQISSAWSPGTASALLNSDLLPQSSNESTPSFNGSFASSPTHPVTVSRHTTPPVKLTTATSHNTEMFQMSSTKSSRGMNGVIYPHTMLSSRNMLSSSTTVPLNMSSSTDMPTVSTGHPQGSLNTTLSPSQGVANMTTYPTVCLSRQTTSNKSQSSHPETSPLVTFTHTSPSDPQDTPSLRLSEDSSLSENLVLPLGSNAELYSAASTKPVLGKMNIPQYRFHPYRAPYLRQCSLGAQCPMGEQQKRKEAERIATNGMYGGSEKGKKGMCRGGGSLKFW